VNTLLLLETMTSQVDARSRLIELRLAEVEAAVDLIRLLGPDEASGPLAHPDLDSRDTGKSHETTISEEVP
ncbi:MAG: hypothetical protein KDA21_05150, partial [Phycisphaerales bacterium]|nr:hypothetical protein [Phycisphaerales bacterium]